MIFVSQSIPGYLNNSLFNKELQSAIESYSQLFSLKQTVSYLGLCSRLGFVISLLIIQKINNAVHKVQLFTHVYHNCTIMATFKIHMQYNEPPCIYCIIENFIILITVPLLYQGYHFVLSLINHL